MFKVLIVDDDILVRVGIKSFIQWEKLGLILVGEASNGKEALELIENECPDIILLDIKMPEMDGIDLLKILNDRKVQSKVIVLSCHDEYVYVREALNLGAVDYILKLSLKQDELKNILVKTRDLLITDSLQQSVKERDGLLDDYINALLEKDTKSYRNTNTKEVNEFISALNSGSSIMCLVTLAQQENQKTGTAFNVVKEINKEYSDAFTVLNSKNEILMILSKIGSNGEISKYIERVLSTLKLYLNVDIAASISNSFESVDLIRQAYSQCVHSMSYSFYFSNREVIYYRDTKPFCTKNKFFSKEITDNLYRSIESKDYNNTCNIISSLFENVIFKKDISPYVVKNCLIEIINIFSSDLRFHNLSFTDMSKISPYTRVLEKSNIYELKQWMDNFVDDYFDFIKQISKCNVRDEIKEAKGYVLENYNQDINLSNVAKVVNMSENYFSSVFKKETGEAFIDFLNRIRIQKAKELVLNHNYKVYEICDMVGYNSVSYFSKMFKKLTGSNVIELKKHTL